MGHSADLAPQVAALRRFNRFYFARMGYLRDAVLSTSWHPSHLRVLRMLGEVEDGTIGVRIAADLGMDAARVSRILAHFRAMGLLREEPAPDGRMRVIRLSRSGFREYRIVEGEATSAADFMLRLLPAEDRARLMESLATAERILRSIPL